MIEIKDLRKNYGDIEALKGIDFSVQKGEILGILGPNGAGKSTAIRILCGFLSASGGKVLVGGHEITPGVLNSSVKRMIGYLPESAPLYKDMIVFDYLRYQWMVKVGAEHGVSAKQRKERLMGDLATIIEQCGLTSVKHKNIGELSKGYRQRVGLASALAGEPEILVLDEPTSGLDPNQIIEIRNLIQEIGKKKTVLLCSHILSEVEVTCDRVVILKEGKIVADDSTKDLKSSMGVKHQLTVGIRGASFDEVREALSAIEGIGLKEQALVGEESDAVGLSISYPREMDKRREIYKLIEDNHWELLSFHQTTQSLEDVFRELTKQEQQQQTPSAQKEG